MCILYKIKFANIKIITNARLSDIFCRIVRNYTVCVGCFTFQDEILAQVEGEKQNIIATACGNITARAVFSGVRDVFGSSVRKSNKRSQGKVKKVFLNLKKIENNLGDTCPTLSEEWESIRANFSTILGGVGDGSWNVLSTEK